MVRLVAIFMVLAASGATSAEVPIELRRSTPSSCARLFHLPHDKRLGRLTEDLDFEPKTADGVSRGIGNALALVKIIRTTKLWGPESVSALLQEISTMDLHINAALISSLNHPTEIPHITANTILIHYFDDALDQNGMFGNHRQAIYHFLNPIPGRQFDFSRNAAPGSRSPLEIVADSMLKRLQRYEQRYLSNFNDSGSRNSSLVFALRQLAADAELLHLSVDQASTGSTYIDNAADHLLNEYRTRLQQHVSPELWSILATAEPRNLLLGAKAPMGALLPYEAQPYYNDRAIFLGLIFSVFTINWSADAKRTDFRRIHRDNLLQLLTKLFERFPEANDQRFKQRLMQLLFLMRQGGHYLPPEFFQLYKFQLERYGLRLEGGTP